MTEYLLKEGDRAPSFTLAGIDEEFTLADYPRVILYFYSKDNTAGCTKQALAFDEAYEDLTKRGYVIAGVSKDSVASHQKFAAKHNLRFHLLADTDCQVAEAYGVRRQKMMYGRQVMGTVRSAFIIEDGVIIQTLYNIKAESSAAEVSKYLTRA